jgi:hypothetical protein
MQRRAAGSTPASSSDFGEAFTAVMLFWNHYAV